MNQRDHDHQWIYDGKSCCYRLQCSICKRTTRAYNVKGDLPTVGTPVHLDGETIEVIGSTVREEEDSR